MAVDSVKENFSGHEAPSDLDGQSAVRRFTVVFDGADSPTAEPILARTADDGTTAIPLRYAGYPDDTSLRVIAVLPRIISPHYYDVTVTYQSGRTAEDPLDEPPDLEVDSYVYTEPIDTDIDGNPIQNAAHEPFPVTEEFHDTLLRFGWNEATGGDREQQQYRNTVNLEPFRGYPAKTCWMQSFKLGKVHNGTQIYWRKTANIVVRMPRDSNGDLITDTTETPPVPIGWRRRFLNQGLRVIDGVVGGFTTYRHLEAKGEPLSAPVPLNQGGTQQVPAGQDPNWLFFTTKQAVSWLALPLEEVT